MNAQTRITAATDIDLTAIIRAEGIRGIDYDPELDRFTVWLRGYSVGGGATVGDALAQAKRRAA